MFKNIDKETKWILLRFAFFLGYELIIIAFCIPFYLISKNLSYIIFSILSIAAVFCNYNLENQKDKIIK